jgi:hypothetical protein
MSAFELVFGLMTIITSLALTHLLAGFVGLLRSAERVRFSAMHALWAWSAFTSTIGNWASYWGLRSLTSWPAWAVLLIVAATIVQYVFCSFVTPETPAEGKIDLVAFHQREHRRYILAAVALFGLALVLNLALGGAHFYADWWRDSAFSIAGVALGLLAFFVRTRWVQIVSAATIAALLTYYLIITCNVVAA